MFYQGETYQIKKATKALQAAVKESVDQQIADVEDPLERYDAMQTALISLPIVRFLVKHLIPDFEGEVTEENRDALMFAIQLAHSDPMRAHVLEVRDARRWEKAKNEHA